MVVRFFGLDGTGKKTLEEVGREFDVTRERVRQITSKFVRRLQHSTNVYLPIFRSACNYILTTLPNSSRVLGEALCRQQIARTEFDISGIAAVLQLLVEEDLFEISLIAGTVLVVEKNTVESFRLVPRIARAIVSAFGCGHIEHILADLEAGHEKAFGNLDVATVLNQLPGVRWLDQHQEWFTILETKRNRLSNVVRKVLSVTRKISISELRGALKRVHRLEGFAPPSDIFRAFCSSLALVGAEVPPGIVEEISQPIVRGSVLVGHGWTDDGQIWISYRLNASNLHSGVFSLPTGLKGIVSGQYFIQSSGTGFRSVVLAEGDRLTAVHRFVAVRGGLASAKKSA
jgi:hypothetical protein